MHINWVFGLRAGTGGLSDARLPTMPFSFCGTVCEGSQMVCLCAFSIICILFCCRHWFVSYYHRFVRQRPFTQKLKCNFVWSQIQFHKLRCSVLPSMQVKTMIKSLEMFAPLPPTVPASATTTINCKKKGIYNNKGNVAKLLCTSHGVCKTHCARS